MICFSYAYTFAVFPQLLGKVIHELGEMVACASSGPRGEDKMDTLVRDRRGSGQ